MTHGPVLSRRQLLRTTVIGGLAPGLPIGVAAPAAAGPALLRTGRPVLTHGVQSGDVLERSGLVWARADRPSRLLVEVSARPDLNDACRIAGPVLWEFVSGPLHAGGFGPNQLDATFGPVVEFVSAPPTPNTSPLDGFQHFGEVEVAPGGATMRVSLRNRAGAELWSTTLEAAR